MDAAPDLVGFARALREEGVAVPTSRVLAFHEAVHAAQHSTLRRLYWVARITLVSKPELFEPFHRAFTAYFGDLSDKIPPQPPRPSPSTNSLEAIEGDETVEVPADFSLHSGPPEDQRGETAAAVLASDAELLRERPFEDLTPDEQAAVHKAIRRLNIATPRRRTRRMTAARAGTRLDVRRTVRSSLATEGELLSREWRARRWAPRSVVLILDVSGSMAPSTRAMLQFGFAAVRSGNPVEVFSVGTRLTRVTQGLAMRDAARALDAAARLIEDWEGGTRIGACREDLVSAYCQQAFLRGALIVICSDGLERGDPAVLEAQVARLSRLAHSLIWVNLLLGDPRYRPLAAGMAAALPHVDAFLPGHNLASLERLGEAIGA